MFIVFLILLGVAVGAVGTLIGAGGGFLLMPALVILYPADRPEVLASISLGAVFFNAVSGSIGYARQRQINYRAGWLFIVTGIPGALAGAFVTAHVPRALFDLWLGGLLIVVALLMLALGRLSPPAESHHQQESVRAAEAKGGVLSFIVGFISSLLGIGGGIVHVPGMVYLLRFPVHLAAGTSHFVLAFTAAAGTLVHLMHGELQPGFGRLVALALGVIVGAQIGARLSKHTPPHWILRVLGVALFLVGSRVVYQALHP